MYRIKAVSTTQSSFFMDINGRYVACEADGHVYASDKSAFNAITTFQERDRQLGIKISYELVLASYN